MRSDSDTIRMCRSDSDTIRMYRSDSDYMYTVHIPDYIGISWPDSAFILVHMLFKFKLQYYVHINMLHNHILYMLYSAYTPLMYMI